MLEVKNIKLKEYLSLYGDELYEYNWVIEYSNEFNAPINHLSIDIMKCSFGFIKDLEYYLEKGMTWEQLIESVNEELSTQLLEYDILRVFQFRKYLINEIEKIIEVEKIVLDSGITSDDERAGIDKLSVYGVYSQIRQYAIAFNQTIDWARKQKYEDAFTELAYQVALNAYQENLFKIRHSST